MDPNSSPEDRPQSPAPGPSAASSASGPPPFMPPVQQIVIQPAGVWLMRIVAGIAWIGLAIALVVIISQYAAYHQYYQTTPGIQEKFYARDKTSNQKIAIIDISGIIMEGEGFVKRQIDKVRSDERVKAVVVRIDSPGGTVTGSDYILHHLKELKKTREIPIVVSMGSMATSGGYYVAMAVGDTEKSIFAEPTTTTGSIGVIIPHYDLSGLLARYDIKNDSIASHPRKQMLSMTKPMDPEHREILQRYVDESFERFKDIVKEGRPHFRDDEAALNELATGEIFTAEQAKKVGLVDEVGWIEDAIDRAIQLAHLDGVKVRVVRYRRNPTLMDQLTSAQSPSASLLDPAVLLEMASPRAYYMSTWMPPVIRNSVSSEQ